MARKSFLMPEPGTGAPSPADGADPPRPARRPPMAKGGAAAPRYITGSVRSHEARTHQDIPVNQIRASAIEDRIDLTEDLGDLVASIDRNGQQVPIIVRIVEGDQPYEIVAGRRRLEATRRLGRPTIRGFVTRMDDREAFIAQGIENNGRLETSFIERARTVSLARDAGFSQDDVSEFLSTAVPLISVMERIYRGVGEDLVRLIGPARGIGRRKWDAALKAIDAARATGADPAEHVDAGIEDSAERFEAFAAAVSGAGDGRPARPAPAPGRGLRPARSSHLDGRMQSLRKPGQLVLKSKEDEDDAFLAFLEGRLAALYHEFQGGKGEADD